MERRRLGSSDLEVSIAGLGCNNFGWFIDRPQSFTVLNDAFEAGINFFDTANNYGMPAGESERILGEAFQNRRDKIIIATKVGDQVDQEGRERGAAPAYVRKAVEQSLRNLRTDYIDLYQLHYPDPQTPIEDTLRVFQDLIDEGKIRYIGCANHDVAQLSRALAAAEAIGCAGFVSCQSEYSLIARHVEADLVPFIQEKAIGFLPYFPLANGLLTGKYRNPDSSSGRLEVIKQIPFFEKFLTEERFAKVERLANISEEEGIPMVDLALGWLASQPHVSSVIAGATKPSQVKSNVEACNRKLPEAIMARLDDVTRD